MSILKAPSIAMASATESGTRLSFNGENNFTASDQTLKSLLPKTGAYPWTPSIKAKTEAVADFNNAISVKNSMPAV